MTKRELIDEITHLNTSASPAFLAAFEDEDLSAYLQRLQRVAEMQAPPKPPPRANKTRRKKQLQAAVA